MNRKPKFNPPDFLSRCGLDSIPPGRCSRNDLVNMDSLKKYEAMLLSVKKDLYRIFKMRTMGSVSIKVDFPGNGIFIEDKKMSMRENIGENWIIKIRGNLSEDMAYVILGANIANIWFFEYAHKASKRFREGFPFWVVYKLAKERGYFKMALISTSQNKEEFDRIRKIEEKSGEYGVFYIIVNGFCQSINKKIVLKKQVEQMKELEEAVYKNIGAPPKPSKALERRRKKKIPEVLHIDLNRNRK